MWAPSFADRTVFVVGAAGRKKEVKLPNAVAPKDAPRARRLQNLEKPGASGEGTALAGSPGSTNS